jgi:hypothetical protein
MLGVGEETMGEGELTLGVGEETDREGEPMLGVGEETDGEREPIEEQPGILPEESNLMTKTSLSPAPKLLVYPVITYPPSEVCWIE